MRVALIADIHGNDAALAAVLDDIERTGVDQVVCLGDVATLGPSPGAVISRLQALGCPCVMGNHDAFLLDPGLIRAYTDLPEIMAAIDWCRHRLSDRAHSFLTGFQPTLELPLDGQLTLLAFHGSPRSHMDDILATTSAADLKRMIAGNTAAVMAGGHTHIQMLRQHQGLLLVNPGSVGLPFKEFAKHKTPVLLGHAEYAVAEANGSALIVSLRRVPYDRHRFREAVRAGDHPLREMLLQS
jgi:predicted phosphodiesterase